MKTVKKESRNGDSKFGKELDSLLRNNSLNGLSNHGIIPLVPGSNPDLHHQFNPFTTEGLQHVNPYLLALLQTNNPYFGIRPFPYPGQQFNPQTSFASQQHLSPSLTANRELVASANIYDDEESYFIELTVPGFRSEDCKVRVKGRILYVKGRRETDEDSTFYSTREYRNNTFERAFLLSDEVETEEVVANCVDGILTLSLPKKSAEEMKEKDIEVGEEIVA